MAYQTVTQHSKLYPYTSIMASPYSCDPTGVIDIAAAIEQIKANQSNVGTIYFPHGAWRLSTALTIPSGMSVVLEAGAIISVSANLTINGRLITTQGGLLNVATGITITINGCFEAGLYQVFSCTGTGKVVFGSGTVSQVYPEWWGAVAGVSAANMSAFQVAVDTGLPVKVTNAYSLDNSSTSLILNSDNQGGWLEGISWSKSKLTFTSNANPGINVGPCSSVVPTLIRNVNLVGPGGTTAGNYGIYLPGVTGIANLNIEYCRLELFGDDAILIQGPTGPVKLIDNYILNINGYGITIRKNVAGTECPQDVTIDGGIIQECLGGINADGTSLSIASLNVIDVDIESTINTKPCLNLVNVIGGVFTNTTCTGTGTLSFGSGVVNTSGACVGNVFNGLLTNTDNASYNFYFSGTGNNNTVIGGYHFTEDSTNSYFAAVTGETNATFLGPEVNTASYATNRNVVVSDAESNRVSTKGVTLSLGGQLLGGSWYSTTDWKDYSGTSTVVGFASYTTKEIRWCKTGRRIDFSVYLAGPSDADPTNGAKLTFTLPFAAGATPNQFGGTSYFTKDNSTTTTTPGRWQIDAAGTTVSCFTNTAGAGWTNANNKGVAFSGWYMTA